MAITNAQQYQQLVNPPMKGKKRPGYRGEDWATEPRTVSHPHPGVASQYSAPKSKPPSKSKGPPGGGDKGMHYSAPKTPSTHVRRGPQEGWTEQEVREAVRRGEKKAPFVQMLKVLEDDAREEKVEKFRHKNINHPLDKAMNYVPYIGPIKRMLGTTGGTRGFLLDKAIKAQRGIFDPNNPNYVGDIYSMTEEEQEDLLSKYNEMRGKNLIDAYGKELIKEPGGEGGDTIPMYAQLGYPTQAAYLASQQAPSIMDQEPELTPLEQALANRTPYRFAAEGGIMNGGRTGYRNGNDVDPDDPLHEVEPLIIPDDADISPDDFWAKRNKPSGIMMASNDTLFEALELSFKQYKEAGGIMSRQEYFLEFLKKNPEAFKPTKMAQGGRIGYAGGSSASDRYEAKIKELMDKGLSRELAEALVLSELSSDAYTISDKKDGGRIGYAGGDVVGGEFDFESARQMYGLGKLVKKITKTVKKIAKSPIGKAALLGATAFGIPGTTFGGLFGRASFGNAARGFFGQEGIKATLFGLPSGLKIAPPTKGWIGEGGNLALGSGKLGIGTLIAGTSLLAGALTPEQEAEAQTIADETGIPIAEIRANPDQYLARRFKAEGGSMKEPVAKKTMPLLDMGGKEMDLREEGGFVPIGRMEKADDVPARLSKNEFVFTADAVRNAGDGDVDKGAEVMYNMMKNLESGGDVSEESQGLEGARKMFQTSQRLGEVI